MSLSNRLKAVYDYLEPNLNMADIGCDHGYLSIEYALNNDCKILAIDNKKGPLKAAQENIDFLHLESKISLILSNGIKDIDDSIKQIAIAGMGGNNIVDILSSNYDKFMQLENLSLQPNNGSYQLRKYLVDNNYKIVDEILIKENDVIYEVIKANKGIQKLDYRELYFGPIILKNKNKLFKEKYNEYLRYLKSLLVKIPSSLLDKLNEIEEEIKLLEEELNYEF